MRGRIWKVLASTAALVIAAAVVSTAGGSHSKSPAGGTYRVGWENSFQSDGFDPTGEFQIGVFGIYTNLLVRTLVGTNHVAGAAGRLLVPDLAEAVPAPTNGGTRYTFTLKRGIRFAPPLDREITSNDVRYAIERLARPANGASYAFYFNDIKGLDDYRAGHAKLISGIATPNARTISFDLTRPAGDFLYRLALPAAAPIPPEVGKCFEGKPGKYGRDLVASGPYMIEGADAVKAGSCAALRPMRGISDTQLTLVRNPHYDPKTDSPAARENNPDRFVFVAETGGRQTQNSVHLMKKVAAGELEDAFLNSWPKDIEPFLAAARKNGLLRVDPAGWVVFVTMNLTQPPFDDVHVRRAMNWVLDRAALRATLPGSSRAATHIVPDELLDNRLAGFAPFKTNGDHGDLAKAKAEMRKSKYGSKSGLCVAKACKGVFFSALFNSAIYGAGGKMTPMIQASAAKIGISFELHARSSEKLVDPTVGIPVSPNVDWPTDYADPAAFVDQLFSGDRIRARENFDVTLVGLTPATAKRLGIEGDTVGVPSVDRDIAACAALAGSPRLDCYAALDRKLTTEIVPWVPILQRDRLTVLGRQVAKWVYDSSSENTAFAHVAVKS